LISRSTRFSQFYLSGIGVALLLTGVARGQATVPLTIGTAAHAAPHGPGGIPYRVLAKSGTNRGNQGQGPRKGQINALTSPWSPPTGILPPRVFRPADLSNPDNGATVVTTQFHPIFVNNPPSHWGDVGTFLTDLGKSDFIHLVDQYVGSKANNRYTLGTSFSIQYPIPANHILTQPDMDNIVHAAALAQGSGLGHIYSLFLPQGVDFCVFPNDCYSPDNEATWTFCAFHTYELFDDIANPVLATLEQYTNVPHCSVPPTGSANNQLIDSTNDPLSHEIFETITDPLISAWVVYTLEALYGGIEVGDICVIRVVAAGDFHAGAGNVNLNGHLYTIQQEYSNFYHACVYAGSPGESAQH